MVKGVLKRLRASPPFNSIATSTVRGLFRTMGGVPEFVVKHLHRYGMVDSELPNGRLLRLHSIGDDWLANQIYWREWHGYEAETTPLFYALAQESEVIIDVGAYVGFYALLAGHAAPSSRVVALEPMEVPFERLLAHVEINGLTNIVCIKAAAGNHDGEAELFHPDTDVCSSTSLSADFMKGTPGLTSSTVQVLRIDTLAEKEGWGRVGLIKIDTETTEKDVLKGLLGVIERDRPDIICEVLLKSGGGEPVYDVLKQFQYVPFLLTKDGPREDFSVAASPLWGNYIFTTSGAKITETWKKANLRGQV